LLNQHKAAQCAASANSVSLVVPGDLLHQGSCQGKHHGMQAGGSHTWRSQQKPSEHTPLGHAVACLLGSAAQLALQV
jgi:hypothetical protein